MLFYTPQSRVAWRQRRTAQIRCQIKVPASHVFGSRHRHWCLSHSVQTGPVVTTASVLIIPGNTSPWIKRPGPKSNHTNLSQGQETLELYLHKEKGGYNSGGTVTSQRAVQQQDSHYIPSSGKQFFSPSIVQPSRSTGIRKVAEVQNDLRFPICLHGFCMENVTFALQEGQISQWTVQLNVYLQALPSCDAAISTAVVRESSGRCRLSLV